MESRLHTARRIAHLLDAQFSFLGIKVGLDSILGFIPGFGDMVALIFSLYLVILGVQMKLPLSKLIQMVTTALIDASIGTIPLIGDLFDLFYKANLKNFEILEEFEKSSQKAT